MGVCADMDMRRGDDAMAAGALAACAGLALYADALGCGRVYGYTAGSAVEFARRRHRRVAALSRRGVPGQGTEDGAAEPSRPSRGGPDGIVMIMYQSVLM